jgi:DNA-binding NarL/FixJ family response regulator
MEQVEQVNGERIRVVLAEDHVLVREGIRQFLEETGGIEVVGEAGDGAEVVCLARQLAPDVALMDINMPGVTGLEATRRIKEQFPGVKVLVLTAYDDEPYIRAFFQVGADGYVLKTARAQEVVEAVWNVYRGLTALSPSVAGKVVRQMVKPDSRGPASQAEVLTERELDVLRLTAKGMTNREIGGELDISHRTVQGHLANVYEKLGANSRTEAVTAALKRGWIVIE